MTACSLLCQFQLCMYAWLSQIRASRKTSPSVALTGKDSKNERISIASRSFIFWPIGKIRLQKKVGPKFSDFRFQNFQISDFKKNRFQISKFSDFRFQNFQISDFEKSRNFQISKFSDFRFQKYYCWNLTFFKNCEKRKNWKKLHFNSNIFEIWNLEILKSEKMTFDPTFFDPTFFWRRIFPIGQKINDLLAMEIRSFLESFPARATEGEVSRNMAWGQNRDIIYLCFYLLKKNKTI